MCVNVELCTYVQLLSIHVCMYVCMHAFISVCVCTCVFACAVCVCVCVVCVCVCIAYVCVVCVYVLHVCVYVCVCVCVCVCVWCVYVLVESQIYIYQNIFQVLHPVMQHPLSTFEQFRLDITFCTEVHLVFSLRRLLIM